MFEFVFIKFVFFILSSCVKENLPTDAVNNPVDTLIADIRFIGALSSGSYVSVNGNQPNALNGSLNFSEYKYVMIHCQKYNHVFGSKQLK